MKLAAGRYLIRNAATGNLAVLLDANPGTDLKGAILGLDDNLEGMKVRYLFVYIPPRYLWLGDFIQLRPF